MSVVLFLHRSEVIDERHDIAPFQIMGGGMLKNPLQDLMLFVA